MESKSESVQQQVPGSRQKWLFGLIFLFPAVVGVLASTYPWSGWLTLLHDPFKISQTVSPLHPLMGSLNILGAAMFFCSSAVALFGATLVLDTSSRRFLIYAGLFSSLLAVDDMFGLHDRVFIEFSVMERFSKLFYVAGQIVYIVAFYKVLRKLNYFVLSGALLLFAVSLALDNPLIRTLQDTTFGPPLTSGAHAAWEDMPKLAGTVLWLWFHMLAARKFVVESCPRTVPCPGQ